MKQLFCIFLLILICFSCRENVEKKETDIQKQPKESTFFSKNVQGTFSISICLPEGYDPKTKKNYPVVYLLDANLYFKILASTFESYSQIGILPEVILVGVGYKK
jgi:predicted alpha/beta superfamily hydrolase